MENLKGVGVLSRLFSSVSSLSVAQIVLLGGASALLSISAYLANENFIVHRFESSAIPDTRTVDGINNQNLFIATGAMPHKEVFSNEKFGYEVSVPNGGKMVLLPPGKIGFLQRLDGVEYVRNGEEDVLEKITVNVFASSLEQVNERVRGIEISRNTETSVQNITWSVVQMIDQNRRSIGAYTEVDGKVYAVISPDNAKDMSDFTLLKNTFHFTDIVGSGETWPDGLYSNKEYGFQFTLPGLFSMYTITKLTRPGSDSVASYKFEVDTTGFSWPYPTWNAFYVSVFPREWWDENVVVDEQGSAWLKKFYEERTDLSMGFYLTKGSDYAFLWNRGHDCPGSAYDTPHCKLYDSLPKVMETFKVFGSE